MNRSERLLPALLLFLLLTAIVAPPLLADDDEDGDDRHHEHHGRRHSELRALPAVQNAKWKQECTSCHMSYPPGLLPERSWRRMMGQLDKHFGEDASLAPKDAREITNFLVTHSADKGETRRAMKISRSIPDSESPLSITETYYFKRKHHEIRAQVWKRAKVGSAANCVACHADAEKGVFDEELVKIPR